MIHIFKSESFYSTVSVFDSVVSHFRFNLLTLCMILNISFHPQPNANDNKIPEVERPVRPTVNEVDIVQNENEIPLLRNGAEPGEEHPSNVLMSHASEDSILKKTEVLAGQWKL